MIKLKKYLLINGSFSFITALLMVISIIQMKWAPAEVGFTCVIPTMPIVLPLLQVLSLFYPRKRG